MFDLYASMSKYVCWRNSEAQLVEHMKTTSCTTGQNGKGDKGQWLSISATFICYATIKRVMIQVLMGIASMPGPETPAIPSIDERINFSPNS